jgi:hypothetical protein
MSRINFTWRSRFLAVGFMVLWAVAAQAQSASFTYQGKLNENGLAVNGVYEMQFRLLDSLANQIGTTNTLNTVSVTGGIFTARVDFGLLAFDGNPRFLEIAVRPAGSTDPFTVLNPPQSVLSAPYALRSRYSGTADLATLATNATNAVNATSAVNASTAQIAVNSNQLGGVPANQYVLTGDARLSDDRDPLPGSGNYVQNTTVQQAVSNFNISGTGRAAILNAVTQFNLNGNRVLSNPGTNNLFVGINAGTNNSTGNGNAFFGGLSGQANTTGINNAFFGFNAGSANNGGGANTFIGVNAGIANVGSSNNTFLGANAGNSNLAGNGNTYMGANSDGALLITNSVAIGQKAFAGQSNALILGSINGINTATADTDVGIGTATPQARFHVVGDSALIGNVGIGTVSPGAKLHVVGNSAFMSRIGIGTTAPTTNLHIVNESAQSNGIRYPLLVETDAATVGMQLRSTFYTAAGRTWSIEGNSFSSGGIGSIYFKDSLFNSTPMELRTGSQGNSFLILDGILNLNLATGGAHEVCISNADYGLLSQCSSSRRYKQDIQPFLGGLSLLHQLAPVTFRWKASNEPDLGFVAEDVATIEPLLTTTNRDGQIEGVKYDRIATVLVNAVKEQQAEIEKQQQQIDELKAIVCALRPDSAVCGKPE